MPNNDVYIYYSGATDVTGQKIQESLDIGGGRALPKTKREVVIGWGPKTQEPVGTKVGGANCTIFNHPDAVRKNRDKFNTILTMREAKVNIKNASHANDVFDYLDSGKLSFPLIGRRNFHQGGRDFWTCLTKSQVHAAIEDENPAQYFQNFIDVALEYRLHIIKGKLVYAQKKVKRVGSKDNTDAFIAQHKDKINAIASKKNVTLEPDTVDYVLNRLARDHQNPDMTIKSNTRGWKFSRIALKNVNKYLLEESIKALKTTELDFGAVDCALDQDGKAWIIEINSGPGLEQSSLKAYVDEFKSLIDEVLNPTKVTVKVDTNKSKTIITKDATGAKAKLQARLSVLNDLVSVASEEESDVLANLWDKLG